MKYIKDGKISNGKFVKFGKTTIINPSKEKMLELGWSVYLTDEQEAKLAEIDKLKAELSESDYKVIKCSEANVMGLELPYNITDLHIERQMLRDKINQLQSEL